MKILKSVLLLSLIVFLGSCLKDEYQDKLADNEAEIQNYIKVKNLTVQKSTEGMYYQITSGGQSARPQIGDLIEFNYKLSVLSSGVIDSSATSKGQVRSLIFGGFTGSIYNLPLSYMSPGDKGIFLLPSNLAYGGSSTDLYGAYSCFRVDAQVVKKLSQSELIERMKTDYKMADGTTTASGLIWKKLKENPTGKKIEFGYTGKFTYVGKFGFNYNHFDATTSSIVYDPVFDKGTVNFSFNAGSFIKGFEEALQLLKEGEKIQIIVPYTIGYGTSGNSSIPGYCPLYFEIEVNPL
jgi:FKBP-type peptidyl-prolyl cis-trans isomerase